MKPAPFTYHAPADLDEAVSLLHTHTPRAAVLAGGQSLMPQLNLRQRRPEVLVDIRRLTGLPGIDDGVEAVTIGAQVTQAQALADPLVRATLPAVHQALSWIGHPATRSVGTVCGSLAHGDPAAELPALLTLLDGRIIARGHAGLRVIPAAELYAGGSRSSLSPEEIVVASVWPKHATCGWGFHEVARRHRDLPIALAAASLTAAPDGTLAAAAIVLGGVADRPLRARSVEQGLIGTRCGDADIEDALRGALDGVDPRDDVHGTADYRRRLVRELAGRALRDAAKRLTDEEA